MVEKGSTTGRREPPPFRRAALAGVTALGPRMVRATLWGEELAGIEISEPAASIRLLLPSSVSDRLVIPEWNGNEFLMPDGTRPVIRTFTPRRLTSDGLDLDIVVHDGGSASAWVTSAEPGSEAAVSGPGRGYRINDDAPRFLLLGDETAIPAIAQLLETIPADRPVDVHIEADAEFGRVRLPEHPSSSVVWHRRAGQVGGELLAAIRNIEIGSSLPVWCAGEAAAMHAIRNHLFNERKLPRSQATVRGYWKLRDS